MIWDAAIERSRANEEYRRLRREVERLQDEHQAREQREGYARENEELRRLRRRLDLVVKIVDALDALDNEET